MAPMCTAAEIASMLTIDPWATPDATCKHLTGSALVRAGHLIERAVAAQHWPHGETLSGSGVENITALLTAEQSVGLL